MCDNVSMKKKDLVQKLKERGFKLERLGGNHDIYSNGIKAIPVPRHREINELTAKSILKQAS